MMKKQKNTSSRQIIGLIVLVAVLFGCDQVNNKKHDDTYRNISCMTWKETRLTIYNNRVFSDGYPYISVCIGIDNSNSPDSLILKFNKANDAAENFDLIYRDLIKGTIDTMKLNSTLDRFSVKPFSVDSLWLTLSSPILSNSTVEDLVYKTSVLSTDSKIIFNDSTDIRKNFQDLDFLKICLQKSPDYNFKIRVIDKINTVVVGVVGVVPDTNSK